MSGGAVAPRLVLATHNAHKVAELRAILTPELPDLDPASVVGAADLEAPEPVEDGVTFAENALVKARALAAATGALAVADDSGIEIDHLGGAPGVRSARWTEEGDWIPRVLRELEGVPPEQRTCRYVCAAAAVWPDGREVVVRGVVEGRVVHEPRGSGGFGYDPIVAPVEGDGRTFAEMTAAEKHAISHRARAFAALAEHL